MQTTSYHNTTNIKGKHLEIAKTKTASQEKIVLSLLRKHRLLSASQTLRLYPSEIPPLLTSIRRALSNLTFNGKLIKTTTQVPGNYKKPEYQYQIQS